VNCLAVRERLVDHALGSLADEEDHALDRHLAWCAACRKEAGELQRAATTFAFALTPATPSAELETRIVGAIERAAGRRHQQGPRRGRLAVAAAVAAMVAVTALGWGAAMAGRAAKFQERAEAARRAQDVALDQLTEVIKSAEFSDPGNRVFVGTLAGAPEGSAGGAALTLSSPSARDFAIVMVSGLRPSQEQPLPYRVVLVTEHGRVLLLGKIGEPDTSGGSVVSKQFDLDLTRYTSIEIRDASGGVILQGSVALRTAIASPSP
jgi:predicted anti-sigma-YlaC factor YlaD